MMFQSFLRKKLRRLATTLFFLVLCMLSAVAVFALLVTALNATGAGAMAIPGAFVCVIFYELGRYFFYRSFFMQQLARFAAWKQVLDESKE
ncbi:hypothetical protein UNDKW_5106 [Undibacterium sp. KW1]|uniref:hypothetical protein n=1 Tax=Undibacterium sp. KW1 TaxID=2058624 RepID=UPI001331F802|nr:hypothetical protein [Undibacterium sp. KW1]BBB63379.1 hypothetical protein UNDKW_5106 [Undibacterium sp. KW1]